MKRPKHVSVPEHYQPSKTSGEAFEKKWLAKVELGDIREVRRLLGPKEQQLSDEEVIAIRDACLKFADTAFHWWRDVRSKKFLENQGAN